jgi:hypothetical protein
MLVFAIAVVAKGAEPGGKSPEEQYEQFVEKFEGGAEPRELAESFFDLAAKFPKDPIAVDSLVWVLTKLRTQPEATRALQILSKDHLHSEQLAAACGRIARTPSPAAETLLEALLEKSPHPAVQAEACWQLAYLLEQQALVIEQLNKQPELAERVQQYYGKEYGDYLASLDRPKLDAKLEQVYQRMLDSFSQVPAADGTMGEVAEKALFRIRHLSIGRVAPEIEGEDIFGRRFKLSDYRGKVVMLSFWGHW